MKVFIDYFGCLTLFFNRFNGWEKFLGGYIMALPSGLRTFADCLMIMSAVVWSSTSIQRIGEDWDILVDMIFISELILSSYQGILLLPLF